MKKLGAFMEMFGKIAKYIGLIIIVLKGLQSIGDEIRTELDKINGTNQIENEELSK